MSTESLLNLPLQQLNVDTVNLPSEQGQSFEPVNLPDVYDPETWPKDLASPLSYVQQTADKIKSFSHEFKEAEYSKPGFCKFRYTVKVNHPQGVLEHEYDTTSLKYFNSKRHAQQAAAYMFVLNPPEWIGMILRGEMPDFEKYKKSKQPTKDDEVSEDTLMPEKALSMDDTFAEIDHFTHEEFKVELSQFPNKFCDMHLDGHIVVKRLKEGGMYPDTNAPITIAMCVKREDNSVIDQTLSVEIRPSEALPYLFWIVSNMKIGEEVMAYTTHHNAYGLHGHHSLVAPEESLLCYIKVISALPYAMQSEENEDIQDTPVTKRIQQATQCNISGKIFYERKLFKLALDQFESGTRRLKLANKFKERLSEELIKEYNHITCLLRSNIAAVYSNNLFFPLPSSKTLSLSKDSLLIQHKIMYNCKRCLKLIPENPKVLYRYARALVYLQEFRKGAKYREEARDYVNSKPEEYKGLLNQFNIELKFAKEREALYLQKSTSIEKKMGSIFAQPLSGDDISKKSKSKKAVNDEISPEQHEFLLPSQTKMNLSDEELLMKRQIKDEIFSDLEEENIETIQSIEKVIYEVDSEGNAVHAKDKPISGPEFTRKEFTSQAKIDLEDPMAPLVDEKGRVIAGFGNTGYEGEDEETEEEDDGEMKLTFCGDPYEFMRDFIRFAPTGNEKPDDPEEFANRSEEEIRKLIEASKI